jgi:SAM-dependent methyltransferase
MEYNPERFWQGRLERKFSLAGVGLRRRGENFNRWVYRARLDRLKEVLSRHKIEVAGKRILEMGCGTGYYIDFWHSLAPSFVMGIDIATKSVEELDRRYPYYVFRKADISQPLSYSGEGFDIITAFDILFHIVDETGFEAAIANIRAYAGEGAYILLTDVFGQRSAFIRKHHFSRSYQRYKDVLTSNGLEIQDMYPQLFILGAPIAVPNRYLGHALLGLWSLFTYPTLIEPIGQLMGAFFYAMDRRMAQRLSSTSSTKIMVCRAG